MDSPEAYIQFTPDLIDDEGKVADESTKEFLAKFLRRIREVPGQVSCA